MTVYVLATLLQVGVMFTNDLSCGKMQAEWN